MNATIIPRMSGNNFLITNSAEGNKDYI